jgi:hypothetical protein
VKENFAQRTANKLTLAINGSLKDQVTLSAIVFD